MAFESETARTNRRVRVDGVWHLEIEPATLHALAANLGRKPHTSSDGYTTFQLSNVRLAAQFGGAS
jgi:hypothetical protein